MDDGTVTKIIILCLGAAIGSGLAYIGITRLFTRITKRSVTSDKQKCSWLSGRRNSLIFRWKSGSKARSAQVRALIEAAELGNPDTVRRLMAQGTNVNAKRHRGGRTALMKASANNHVEVVQLLLDNGAEVDTRGGKSAKTALMRASENNCIAVVRILLSHKAEVDKHDAFAGKTALMLACQNGHLGASEVLLEHGSDPNSKDHRGRTALMFAVMKHHRDGTTLIQRLIERGAQVNEEDHNGKRAMDMAFEAGINLYVELLEAHGAVFGKYAGKPKVFFEQSSLEQAYSSLKSKETDSDEQIRTQYHMLVKTYHPDTIHAKELPEEFVAVAEMKFQEIHESYQRIMQSRKRT